VSQINANHIFESIETTSLSFTTLGIERNYTWPFAIFDHFETTALQIIGDTGANMLGITPLVMDKDRQDYEDFIFANQGWIPSGTDASVKNPFIFCMHEEDSVYNGVYPEGFPCPQADLYAVISQVAPLAEQSFFLGYNGFDFYFYKRLYDGMMEAGEAVLSEVLNLIDPTPLDQIKADQSMWPVSYMTAPIFKTPDEGADIVALLTAELPWHSYFTNLIPEGIDGIYLVVRNTCEQEFTYRIDGPEVAYLGPTDLHNTGYDNLEVTTEFTSFKSIADCTYSFHLFPSEEFEKTYQTNDPLVSSAVIFSVFMLTALVFVIYDFLVERRQKKVLTSATRTGALVNSLFPATVRDRLMDDACEAHASKGEDTFTVSQDKEETVGSKSVEVYKTKPIADVFQKTTVMFGDLVGFTSW
jgi:hypothetical protein